MKQLKGHEKVTLFYQFNSKFYQSNKLEKMVKDATDLAQQNILGTKLEYNRIDVMPPHTILREVIRYANASSFCVFELSDNNPNVMFELGYAYGKGKGIALLKSRKSNVPIPSDLSGLNFMEYDDPLLLIPDLSVIIEKNIRKTIKNRFDHMLRRIWSFEESDIVTFVSGNLKGHFPILTYDMSALLEAVLTVKALYPRGRIERLSTTDLAPQSLDHTNIVSVGGPSSNEATKYLLDQVNFPWENIRPTPDSKQIMRNKITGETRKRELDTNGRVKKDFGFFMKIPHPRNKHKTAVLVAALTTEGVLGSAKMFSMDGEYSETNCQKLSKLIGDSRYFAVVTETEVHNDQIQPKPLCNEVYTFNPQEKEWQLA